MTLCPKCHFKLPFFRVSTWKQAFEGGWTCPNCGCEVDRKGKDLTKNIENKLYHEELIKERARLQAQKEFKSYKKK